MKDRPSDQAIYQVFLGCGSVRATARKLGLSRMTTWRAIQRIKNMDDGKSLIRPNSTPDALGLEDEIIGDQRVIVSRKIKTLEDLLEAANVGDGWVVTRFKANAWQALGKDGDITQLHQVTAHLERSNDFWVTPIEVDTPIKRKPWSTSQPHGLALIVPDTQHGFRVAEDMTAPGLRRWEPMHCRKSIDCVLKICDMMKHRITHVVFLGDHLDLAPWSTRWPSSPDTMQTTNAAMRELYAGLLRPIREMCPSAEMVYTIGNHESRISDFLTAKAPEASTIRTADSLNEQPVLSLSRLLALDTLDIELIEPYGKPYWLFDDVKVIHGAKAKNIGGATAAEYLKTATTSLIYGHIHRLEMAQRRIEVPGGSKLITAASPGCLTSLNQGVVPARAGAAPDWQTGVGLIYQHDDGHSISMIPIQDGVAVVEGQVIRGIDDIASIREATGIPF